MGGGAYTSSRLRFVSFLDFTYNVPRGYHKILKNFPERILVIAEHVLQNGWVDGVFAVAGRDLTSGVWIG